VYEDINAGLHCVRDAVDPPTTHLCRKLSARLQAVCLISFAIHQHKLLTLVLLGKMGALNSSPHPSTRQSSLNGWRASRATACLHYSGSGYPEESYVAAPLLRTPGRAEVSPRAGEMGGQKYSRPILSAFHPAGLFAVAGESGTSQVENTLGPFLFFFPLK